jgi:hypothetical protein
LDGTSNLVLTLVFWICKKNWFWIFSQN